MESIFFKFCLNKCIANARKIRQQRLSDPTKETDVEPVYLTVPRIESSDHTPRSITESLREIEERIDHVSSLYKNSELSYSMIWMKKMYLFLGWT